MKKEEEKKIKVLVLDPDLQYADNIKRFLTHEGYQAKIISSKQDIENKLKKERFQIAIIDPTFDDIGGSSIISFVRRIDSDVCIIILTGSPSFDYCLEALRYGAFDFITKPVDDASFREVLDRAINTKGLVVDFERQINIEIGKRIRQLRKQKKLTLKQLANRTNLSISLISQVERAKSSSSVSTLYKIATALNVKLEHLFIGI